MTPSTQQRLQSLPAPRPQYAIVPESIPGPPQGRPDIHALYVHVPFCTTKCHYCDFYSLAGHLDQADAFLDALDREASLWESKLGKIAPETIFIGGGTPTLLNPPQLERLLAIVARHINGRRLEEFTIEANPNTFDAARARTIARGVSAPGSAGGSPHPPPAPQNSTEIRINRISFGAQSFVPSELATLQRDHDPENVARAFDIAAAAGINNRNLDLIFGIPGQTLETWEFSLAQALALGATGPEHMSCYSLIYEPNTAMTARLKRGEFAAMDEELELALFHHVHARLRGAGYQRYEISNYAKPARQCRHNLHYWKAGNWLAWGPAAAGHICGHRWKNIASLGHYLEALAAGDSGIQLPLTQMEHLSPKAWAAEAAAFWLRLDEGINYAEFLQRTAVDARSTLEPALRHYADMGFVQLHPDRARLTEKAIPVSNRILAAAFAAFE